MLTLAEVYAQASTDKRALRIDRGDSVSYVRHGVKVTRYSNGEIAMFYVGLGGNDYDELSSRATDMVLADGWYIGCVRVSIQHRRKTLERLDSQLLTETDERMRAIIGERISECEQKLQTLLSKYNGNN